MEFSILNLEVAVCGLMLALILADLFRGQSLSGHQLGVISAIGLGMILAWSFGVENGIRGDTQPFRIAYGFFVLDGLALWAKRFSMLATLASIFLSLRFMGDDDQVVESIALQLAACLGMMLAASAVDFTGLFVSLELLTVAFYILVSFRRGDALSLEAGVKYLIYGSLASGVLLYGIALIYGATGSTAFSQVTQYAQDHPDSMLLRAGLVLVFTGLAFKISAVPFHWWTPDVYEGAPAPTVALLATGSKGVGFVVLIRVLFGPFQPLQSFWLPLICVASGASILLGNLAGLSQSNLKRLMGYSSISHSGYMLLGVATLSLGGLTAVLYYLAGYLIANALVFAAMCETTPQNGRQEIRLYAGLGSRSPWAAAVLVMGLLSLSGIPPLAGFFGKFVIFRAAWDHGLGWLLVVAVVGAAASLYYYLGVLRSMYFGEPAASEGANSTNRWTKWVFAVMIIGVILIGFYPEPWWHASRGAISFAIQP